MQMLQLYKYYNNINVAFIQIYNIAITKYSKYANIAIMQI